MRQIAHGLSPPRLHKVNQVPSYASHMSCTSFCLVTLACSLAILRSFLKTAFATPCRSPSEITLHGPSIDAAVASIERQLRKNKSRLEKRLRKGAFDQPNDAFFVPDVDADEEPSYQLVRTKRFFFRPMNVDEAILQMNLVGHTFFAFRNEDEGGAFSVVYKRNDGGYGIIVDQD